MSALEETADQIVDLAMGHIIDWSQSQGISMDDLGHTVMSKLSVKVDSLAQEIRARKAIDLIDKYAWENGAEPPEEIVAAINTLRRAVD